MYPIRLSSLALLLPLSAIATPLGQQLADLSADITAHADTNAITESLYRQFRPRVRITDTTLDQATIDRRTRDYIAEMYTPTLIRNYSQLYDALVASGQGFSDCAVPTAITPGDDVLKALCLEADTAAPTVGYLSNPYGQGWKSTARFRFGASDGGLRLIAIEVPDAHGAGVYVKGL